jgi:hypothetical protein
MSITLHNCVRCLWWMGATGLQWEVIDFARIVTWEATYSHYVNKAAHLDTQATL